jgi:hypothetical protein
MALMSSRVLTPAKSSYVFAVVQTMFSLLQREEINKTEFYFSRLAPCAKPTAFALI